LRDFFKEQTGVFKERSLELKASRKRDESKIMKQGVILMVLNGMQKKKWISIVIEILGMGR
jgi:hypothetical protein